MSGAKPADLRIGALFVSDWTHEFVDYARGRVPSHRLFGMATLAERGHVVRHAGPMPARLRRRRRAWPLWQAVWAVLGQRRLDVLFATHESAALAALAARRLGLLRRPVAVLTVAASSTLFGAGRLGPARRRLLAGADLLVTLSTAQVEVLEAAYPGCPVAFCPLGIDTGFFGLGHRAGSGRVLSVGTNPGKDFPTLVRALSPRRPALIVTDADNARAARAAMDGQDIEFRSDVPITELRELYATAETMVFPLREVDFSSGQTVLLEALAMGVPCIVSGVTHIRDYADPTVVHQVAPGDAAPLRAALEAPPRSDRHGRREFVLRSFSADHMADRLEFLLRRLVEEADCGGRRFRSARWRVRPSRRAPGGRG